MSPLKRPLLTLRQDLLAAIFQHLHLLAAYLTPHMITGTICQHSHLFLLCKEALWPDESKMLPASNKCSTMSPVNKHYKCSVPENGNVTSCPKPKLQTSQLTGRVKVLLVDPPTRAAACRRLTAKAAKAAAANSLQSRSAPLLPTRLLAASHSVWPWLVRKCRAGPARFCLVAFF